MKFLFIDEFKYKSGKEHQTYGIVGALIDANFYRSFKESFNSELKKIGWDKKYELKGRSMFSEKHGDSNISVQDRIDFMSRMVNLSSSKSGKSTNIHAIVSFDFFKKEVSEYDCYKKCVEALVKKIKKNLVAKKSLVGVFYDQNNCIDEKDFSQIMEESLKVRGYSLFESPYSVSSSLNFPGIAYADYICYFHQTFFEQSLFRKKIMTDLFDLLEKDEKGSIADKEMVKLKTYLKNYRKENKTKELILALKKVTYT